jgi:hypothetical protein
VSELNPKTEILESLKSLSEAVPNMRAGQLIAAIGELCCDLHGRGLWEADDREFLEAIWAFRRGLEAAAVIPAHDHV